MKRFQIEYPVCPCHGQDHRVCLRCVGGEPCSCTCPPRYPDDPSEYWINPLDPDYPPNDRDV